MTTTILRIPAAKTQSGYSRSTIYLRIAQGLWTKPVTLGPRAVGWPSKEIEALNAARISGKTDTQIRELVETLHTKRKDLMAAWGLCFAAARHQPCALACPSVARGGSISPRAVVFGFCYKFGSCSRTEYGG